MVISYKSYKGFLRHMEQINNEMFFFQIQADDITITFKADIRKIRVVDCPANESILSEIKKTNEQRTNGEQI